MTRAGAVVVVAVAALGMACMGHGSQGARAGTQSQTQTQAQPQPQNPTPQAGGEHGMAMMQECPMAVPGAQVAATDTETGEAITFTTSSPDAVQELRDRVHAMADMHNRHMEAHAGMQGDAQDGSMHGDTGGEMGGTGREGSAGSGDGSPSPDAQGQAGSGMGSGMHSGMHHRMPASRATVEEVDGGARVTVAAQNPADADQLRTAIRKHVDQMQQTGSCGMGGMPDHDMQQPSQQQ
jgi:hypothetical protein